MTTSTPAPPRGTRGRTRITLSVLAAVLAVAGVALVLGASDRTPSPPRAPAAGVAAGPLEPVVIPGLPAPAGSSGAAVPDGDAGAPARSLPASISIPSIDVSSPVNTVGLDADGRMEVPAPGPRYDQAAWFRGSVTPGENGPSVIIGHVDSARNGPSIFYDLGALRPGAAFTVTREDGSVLTFRVDGVRSYPKDDFPTRTVYGPTTRPELRLITCGGDFDSSARSYRDNTVVFAHLLS